MHSIYFTDLNKHSQSSWHYYATQCLLLAFTWYLSLWSQSLHHTPLVVLFEISLAHGMHCTGFSLIPKSGANQKLLMKYLQHTATACVDPEQVQTNTIMMMGSLFWIEVSHNWVCIRPHHWPFVSGEAFGRQYLISGVVEWKTFAMKTNRSNLARSLLAPLL